MSAHLDLDGLCDLLAGEGEQDQLGHVAGCPACSQALAELEQAQEPVRALLAALPPPDVPADLAARLDAALLRAREEDLAAARSADRPLLASVQPGGGRGASRRVQAVPAAGGQSWLVGSAAAVAVLLVLAGVLVGASRMGGGQSSDSTASSGLAAAPEPAAQAAHTSASGTDYGPGEPVVAAALPVLLRASATQPAVAAGGGPLAHLRTARGLADCLAALADAGLSSAALALDYARYHDEPALVVVLPASAPERLDVVVVGPGCGSGGPDVLLHAELPRAS